MPAACSAFSLHSMVVTLVTFRSCSPTKIPAPGMPREIVLPDRDDDMVMALLLSFFSIFFFWLIGFLRSFLCFTHQICSRCSFLRPECKREEEKECA